MQSMNMAEDNKCGEMVRTGVRARLTRGEKHKLVSLSEFKLFCRYKDLRSEDGMKYMSCIMRTHAGAHMCARACVRVL